MDEIKEVEEGMVSDMYRLKGMGKRKIVKETGDKDGMGRKGGNESGR